MQKNTIRFFVFLVFQCTAVLLHYYSLLLLYFQLLKRHVQARLGSGHDGANPIKVPVIWWWVFSPVSRFANSLFANVLSCFTNVSGQTSCCMTSLLKTFLSYFLFHLLKRTKLFGFVFLSDHTSFLIFVIVAVLQKNHLLCIIQQILCSFACEGCSKCLKGHQLNNCKS